MTQIQDFFFQHTYLIGIISFLFGWLGMPLVLKIAKTKGFVVRPNKRMSHTGEVPNIGGINICFSFLLTYMIFEYDQMSQSQFFLIGLFAIMAVGFIDDVLILTPTAKLLGEALAGIALIGFADLRITHLHGIFGIEQIGLIPSYVLSLFILIAIINAVNLIDGIDGLSGSLSVMALIGFLYYFTTWGVPFYSIIIASLIGVLLAFLWFNIWGNASKNRKIFMGDTGSLTLGFLLSFLCLKLSMVNLNLKLFDGNGLLISMTLLFIPTFDAARVALMRIIHGRSPMSPDKTHIHHKLMRLGLSQHQTLVVISVLAALYIALNYFLSLVSDFNIIVVTDILLYALLHLLINFFIKQRASAS
jgi:UDP-N-acetylmuramyl pentapeptide phosphotransferase/UDP-N-acetylglucosamine-1-phosphate transferase